MKENDNIEYRKSLYKKVFEEAFEIYESDEKEKEEIKEKEVLVRGEELDLLLNEFLKNKTTIFINKKEFKIAKIMKNQIILQSKEKISFKEKEIVEFCCILDAVEYACKDSIEKINNENNLIAIKKPEKLKEFKKRADSRVFTNNVNVGIYWYDMDTEFLGEVNDISKVGLGLKFSSLYFDFEFFRAISKEITSNKKYNTALLLSVKNDYMPIHIEIKHINLEEKTDTIYLGCEFIFNDDEQKENLFKYIEEKTLENEEESKLNRTLDFLDSI